MAKKIILVGGGGHCKSCIEVIESSNTFQIVGILDLPVNIGSHILGYEVLGNDNDIPKYVGLGYYFLITVGQIKNASVRDELFKKLKRHNAQIATVIANNANVSKYAEIGEGTIVMSFSMVNAGAIVGENCILNTSCNLEHDVVLGSNSHISTHAVVNGGVEVGNRVFIGSNATISNNIKLADDVVVGAGAVVVNNISEKGVYVGNPAKSIEH